MVPARTPTFDVGRTLLRLRAIGRDNLAARREAETELAAAYKHHPEARDAIVRELMPIADAIANRFYRGGEGMEDLRQVASMGLLMALRRFDPERGTSFVAFAIPTVQGEVRRHFRDHTWAVHVPRRQQERAQLVTATARRLQSVLGHEPTVKEIAGEIELDEEEVVEAIAASRGLRASSLDAPAGADDEPARVSRGELFAGERDPGYQRAEDRATIGQLTAGLPERDRHMLALRFGEELSQAKIGQEVGLSQMHVSRSLRRILTGLNQQVDPGPLPAAR